MQNLILSHNDSYVSSALNSATASGDYTAANALGFKKFGHVFKEGKANGNVYYYASTSATNYTSVSGGKSISCGSSKNCVISCSCNTANGWYDTTASTGASYIRVSTYRSYAFTSSSSSASTANAQKTCYHAAPKCPDGWYENEPNSSYFAYTSTSVGTKNCYKATACAGDVDNTKKSYSSSYGSTTLWNAYKVDGVVTGHINDTIHGGEYTTFADVFNEKTETSGSKTCYTGAECNTTNGWKSSKNGMTPTYVGLKTTRYTNSTQCYHEGSCETFGYKSSIPTGQTCTEHTISGYTCYKDCKSNLNGDRPVYFKLTCHNAPVLKGSCMILESTQGGNSMSTGAWNTNEGDPRGVVVSNNDGTWTNFTECVGEEGLTIKSSSGKDYKLISMTRYEAAQKANDTNDSFFDISEDEVIMFIDKFPMNLSGNITLTPRNTESKHSYYCSQGGAIQYSGPVRSYVLLDKYAGKRIIDSSAYKMKTKISDSSKGGSHYEIENFTGGSRTVSVPAQEGEVKLSAELAPYVWFTPDTKRFCTVKTTGGTCDQTSYYPRVWTSQAAPFDLNISGNLYLTEVGNCDNTTTKEMSKNYNLPFESRSYNGSCTEKTPYPCGGENYHSNFVTGEWQGYNGTTSIKGHNDEDGICIGGTGNFKVEEYFRDMSISSGGKVFESASTAYASQNRLYIDRSSLQLNNWIILYDKEHTHLQNER